MAFDYKEKFSVAGKSASLPVQHRDFPEVWQKVY